MGRAILSIGERGSFMDKDTSGDTIRVFPIPGVSPEFTEHDLLYR